jgi:hypothetical protein
MISLGLASLIAVLSLASLSAAHAENCASANRTVAGTLAGASNPCAPVSKPSARKPIARSAPKEPGARTPGTYKHGNTTVHIGGSVSTDVTVRGR